MILHRTVLRSLTGAMLSAVVMLCAAVKFGAAVSAEPLSADESKPNVLLILIDDVGYGELGCQGNPQVPTPHIDSLAEHGIRMTAGYVTASFCSPSRAGLLTGRYQNRFGHELNPVGIHNLDTRAGLPLDQRTIADGLRDAGYVTGLIGKWHLGGTAEHHPLRRGFDEFYGFLHEGHYYVPGPPWNGVVSFLRRRMLPPQATSGRFSEGDVTWSSHLGYNEPPYDDHNPILQNHQQQPEPEYLTDALSREAVSFIDRHREQPFFLYLSYNAVHSPLQGTHEYMARFAHIDDIHRRVFAAMLSQLDDGIGTVLQKLRETDLESRTLILFLSDNGGPTRELTSSNAPLRGGKGDLYEGGIRVPFLVQWRGTLPEGMTYAEPVISTDVLNTCLAAAGVLQPTESEHDGQNLLPYLTGATKGRPHQTLYWRMGPKAALRDGDWKIVRQPARGEQSAAWELYNLADDEAESNDLSALQPDILRDLEARWQTLNESMVPPVWTPAKVTGKSP